MGRLRSTLSLLLVVVATAGIVALGAIGGALYWGRVLVRAQQATRDALIPMAADQIPKVFGYDYQTVERSLGDAATYLAIADEDGRGLAGGLAERASRFLPGERGWRVAYAVASAFRHGVQQRASAGQAVVIGQAIFAVGADASDAGTGQGAPGRLAPGTAPAACGPRAPGPRRSRATPSPRWPRCRRPRHSAWGSRPARERTRRRAPARAHVAVGSRAGHSSSSRPPARGAAALHPRRAPRR